VRTARAACTGEPVALYSGVVPVGADGKITIPFQIPSYRGQVRIMAVVAGAQRIGHAEADVTVKDPLVVQTTFPRFVTQNDELQIPVFMTNMSGGPMEVTVKLESSNLPIPGLVMPKEFAGAPEFQRQGHRQDQDRQRQVRDRSCSRPRPRCRSALRSCASPRRQAASSCTTSSTCRSYRRARRST